MAFVRLNAQAPLYWPGLHGNPWLPVLPAFNSSLLMDAAGEKVALLGRVWWPERDSVPTKEISRVQFRFGAVTKTSGNGLIVSLQDVDSTVGPPGRPDLTPDQTVSIALADAGFASNSWYRTATFDANRTVNHGNRFAVVFDLDMVGSVVISSWAHATTTLSTMYTMASLYSGAAWAAIVCNPLLVFEFSDGTFGTFIGMLPYSNFNTHQIQVNTAIADEVALKFQVPVPMRIDALAVTALVPAGQAFEAVLYQGTTVLAFVANSTIAGSSASQARIFERLIPEITLTPGIDYYLAARPTTTTTSSFYSYDVNDAAHWPLSYGDPSCVYATRLDQGAWEAPTLTRRLIAAVRICALDDGTASVGGGDASGGSRFNRGFN